MFSTIYSWFENWISMPLSQYLWGMNCEGGDPLTNHFNWIGMLALGISLAFVIAYYYIPFYGLNHPRTNRWWNWLIILAIVGLINFFIAYGWSVNKLLNDEIPTCWVHGFDAGEFVLDNDGNPIELIKEKHCVIFGFVNLIISIAFYTIWSFILKWWSRNCKHSPFF